MRLRRTMPTATAVLMILAVLFALPAPVAYADSTPQTYIVQLKAGVSADRVTTKIMGASAKVIHKVFQGGIVTLTPAQAQALAANPDVASIHKDAVVKASATEINAPWDLDILDSPTGVLDTTYTPANDGSGVTVYVIDSGIFRAHTEFANVTIAAGINFVTKVDNTRTCDQGKVNNTTVDPTDTGDQAGHGTAVSSVIAGKTLGDSKGVTIVPVRVLDCDGNGYESDVLKAADYVASNHAAGAPAVANLSFGGSADTTLDTALQALVNGGVTVVAAAGNGDSNHVGLDACTESPARLPAAITVASINQLRAESTFSNYGSCVDLYAPGESVTVASTKTAYTLASGTGTSFSAPLVAGEAAQVLHDHPTWSPAQVAAEITARATPGLVTGARSANLLLNTTGRFSGTAPTIDAATDAGQTTATATLHWSPTPASVTYQWYRDGQVIPGATAATYPTTDADAQASLTVAAAGSLPGYTAVSGTSDPFTLPAPMTPGTPSISGSAAVSYTLSAAPGTWDPADVSLSYQWLRDGAAIAGASAVAYAPVDADVGHTLSVRVTGAKAGYLTTSVESAPTPAIQSATSSLAYEAFVKASYQDFLGRQPSADELAAATAQLSSGAVSKADYLSALTKSNEWLTAIVTKMYRDTLQRDPDPAGLADWVSWLRSGRFTVAEAASRFYSSTEYYTDYAGNSTSSWVTLLYQKLLNRAPDAQGLSFWITKTNAYGRDWVAYNFYQSVETRSVRVEAMYQALLYREPDPVGWPFWTARVLTTGDLTLAWEIANSDEYWARAHVRY